MLYTIRCLFFIGILFPALLKAQPTDTLVNHDSVKVNSTQNKHGITHMPLALAYVVPGAMVTYGALSFSIKGIRNIDYHVYNEHQRHNPNFSTSADNYLQYAPAVAAYGLGLAGVHAKHNLADRTLLLFISEAIAEGSALVLKHTVSRERPDKSDDHSFVSGHAARAFAGAEYMNQEYGDTSPWYSAAGYATAAGTGVLRLYNNKHWLSDVVAGAGFGILSAKAAYLIYPVIKRQLWHNHDPEVWLMPSYQNGAAGFALMKRF